MPFYEYQCDFCQEEHLVFLLMGEELQDESCPACKKGKLQKSISISATPTPDKETTAKQRVDDFIEKSKGDFKKEKSRLKNREVE